MSAPRLMALERLLMFEADERSMLYFVARNFLMVGRETPERASSGWARIASCDESATVSSGENHDGSKATSDRERWAECPKTAIESGQAMDRRDRCIEGGHFMRRTGAAIRRIRRHVE